MTDQVKITVIEPDGETITRFAPRGKTVWEAMEMMGWETAAACGGQGTCGKCKFRMAGELSPITPSEREHLMPEEMKAGHRLACLAHLQGDIQLCIDYWDKADSGKQHLLRYQSRMYDDTPIRLRDFYIQGRLQDAHNPLYDRIKKALPDYRLQLSVANLCELAALDRPGRPALELHALIMDQGVVPYIARQREKVYGLALDIGSTSLFAALVDMQSGGLVAMASHSNMQRIYGDDVISRINYTIQHEDGVATLHKILINNLNAMIQEMVQQSGADHADIYRATAVGNPVMLHLLLGLSVAELGRAPYLGIFGEAMEIPAGQLGLEVNPLAQLHILPQLGGFVGADTTGCLLSLAEVPETTYLLLDIGTNGEIVLYHQGQMWTASAAAGPAFEGGAISCGMRAGNGAVDRVRITDGELELRVIGGGPPRGICGSGLIDLIALLLHYHVLDPNGIISAAPCLGVVSRNGSRGRELVLREAGATMTGSPLVLDQEDVRQLQLARSAIRTAIEILMVRAGVTTEQIQRVYLAGAFGSYLDPVSVTAIGLIPPLGQDKIKNIGNAAAQGAIMALLSQKQAQAAAAIRSQVQYVELADEPDFQELFIRNLNF